MENNEMNLNELEGVVGGRGGYSKKPPELPGLGIYKIKSGDNLNRIAHRYNTTAEYLKSINSDVISNINDITAGFYIYVPA